MAGHSNKLYAGLACDAVEFFKHGSQLKAFSDGRVKSFNELSFFHMQTIREAINANSEIKKHLLVMHPDSEMKRLEQFATCNFAGLDHEPDIKNGVLQEGEYWDCPKRGICPAEGIVCKPLQFNGNTISAVEIKMIKLAVTDLKNEVIADKLLMPLGTFHLLKQKLYEKLGVSTKQEVAIIGVALNIIQASL